MKRTFRWVQKHCEPYMTYDFTFQIWKRIGADEYWAYDEDCKKFVKAIRVAVEEFDAKQSEYELVGKHYNGWCGEVDNAYDCTRGTSLYAWFERYNKGFRRMQGKYVRRTHKRD